MAFEKLWEEVSNICANQYDMSCGNNAKFVGESIFSMVEKTDRISYAECGVYRGTTFMPIYHLCEMLFDEYELFGIDSFGGFPDGAISENDEFKQFVELYHDGKITEDHFQAAKKRYKRISDNEHLTSDYFSNYSDEFCSHCKGKQGIHVVKCSFESLSSFISQDKRFDVVFLDCDLYKSYMQCLSFFHNRTNLFILDEYYSLKYPGARIAVDKFIEDKEGWSLFNKIETNPYFERWGLGTVEKK